MIQCLVKQAGGLWGGEPPLGVCQDIAVWSGGARGRGFVWGGAAVRPGLPRFADLTFWAAGAKERWCRPGRHQLAFATRGHALCGMFGDKEITWYAVVWPVGTCGYLRAPPCPVAGRIARSRPVIAREGSSTDSPLTHGPSPARVASIALTSG